MADCAGLPADQPLEVAPSEKGENMAKERKSQDVSTTADAVQSAVAGKLVPKERTHFRALLLANPNYFGNLKQSAYAPVKPIQANKTYEEIGCVGFHPQSKRLDAVVFVKEPSGYGGGICTKGSVEYVRFYVSFDNGATWVDQGFASFNVYDVPEGTAGKKRLEYAAGVTCNPKQKLCYLPNTLRARAILSWNHLPPADQPDFPPVWGEVHDTFIQVDPLDLIDWFDLVEVSKFKLPPQFAEIVDLSGPVKLKEPKVLSVAELHAAYKGKGVEPHRYALPAVQKMLAQPAEAMDLGSVSAANVFAELAIDLNAVLNPILSPGDGSTFYEQMECVGFNPNTSELVAVLRLKRPNGYSGGPCTAGSKEYVTFWADLNGNGYFETCLGTASVRVHDIQNIPDGGLEYSVFLPVNFGAYKKLCTDGPRLIPIRAILSWNSVPQCALPDKAPVWGNREDTLILLPPGKPVVPGDFKPVLFNVSSVAVCDIDQATGLAPGDRPFGGALYIVGAIPAADGLATPDRFKYRIFYRQAPAGGWQPLTTDFGVTVDMQIGPGNLWQLPLLQQVDAVGPYAGYFTYREYGIGTNTWRRIAAPYMGLLGVWSTAQPMSGRWEIRVEAIDTFSNVTYVAETTHCLDGTTRQNVIVKLDEYLPVPSITITDFSTDGGVNWQPAVPCDELVQGVLIRGTYSVSDDHFGVLTLAVEPVGPAGGAAPSPALRQYIPVPTTGETGTWTLDTAPMAPCGYVVRIDAYDRTIVSGGGGWHDYDSVGFCLRKPQ